MYEDSGIIFDIKRFALHDGPGIRTTVFLKGCPLRCKWCSNPESQKREPELLFYEERCTLCGKCEKVCPVGAHQTVNGIHTLDRQKCTGCGQCVGECFFDAVSLQGELTSVDTIIRLVLRDKKYYEKSGGGITLSGGDPLFQASFTKSILERAKKEGLHTCIETAGAVSQAVLKDLLPLVDLFLFDYKITDTTAHEEFTGVKNNIILKNLGFLHDQQAAIILRCPVIPGINDHKSHFSAIAGITKKFTGIQAVELMPYHEFGREKYNQLGRKYEINAKAPSAKQVESWLNTLRAQGCENVRKG